MMAMRASVAGPIPIGVASVVELEPSVANRFNPALALIALGRIDEARDLLVVVTNDPVLGKRARAELARRTKR